MTAGNTQLLEDQFHLGIDEIQMTLSQATDLLQDTRHTLNSSTAANEVFQ